MKIINSKYLSKINRLFPLIGIMTLVLPGLWWGIRTAEMESLPPEKPEFSQPDTLGKLVFSQTVFLFAGANLFVKTANADGTGETTLTTSFPQSSDEPSWSPDGTKIVYTTFGFNDIFVMNAGGSDQTNITNTPSVSERNAVWSPAGKIAYEREGQIWLMNTDGSNQTVFSAITQPLPLEPAWSFDGTKLAFTSGGEIWVINSNGTNERRVTNNSTADTSPSWSPDGTKIIFGKAGSGIAVINADGTDEVNLSNGSDRQPSWSSDGTKIAFVRKGTTNENGIYTMNPNGGSQLRVIADVQTSRGTENNFPMWQPVSAPANIFSINGRITRVGASLSGVTVNLSGSATATATTDSNGNFLFSNLTAGGNYTVTPTLPNYVFTPASRSFNSLNANQIADFTATETCSIPNCQLNGRILFVRGSDIYISNTDGSNPVNITNESTGGFNADPSFSFDGTKIAFIKNFEIYRMNSDGTNITRLTTNSITDRFPVFSPDGTKILFVSDRDGNDEIYRMNADGTAQVRLTNDPSVDTEPSFSPDGTKIVFSKRSNLQNSIRGIFIMNADGTNQTQITNPVTTTANLLDLTPSFSPDGTKIVFSRYNTGPFTSIFYLMNIDGSNQTPFGPQGFIYNPSFSPDGTKIIYSFLNGVSSGRYDVATVNLDGTSVSTLVTFGNQPDWQPIRPASTRTPFDFDGDRRADVAVFRPSAGYWYTSQNPAINYGAFQFGQAGDKLAPADYDGDGKTDIAVIRNGNWYIQRSSLGFSGTQFGDVNDVPVPADYDGDGKADIAVFRPSNGTWYLLQSQAGFSFAALGLGTDKPVPGDYNGDGKAEVAVFRPSNGYWYLSTNPATGYGGVQFGAAEDKLVPADYDGDGKTDLAVFRPSNGTWYLLRSTAGFAGIAFGLGTDIPAAADYDGDGKADVAVVRNGNWYIQRSTQGFTGIQFGVGDDLVIPNSFVR